MSVPTDVGRMVRDWRTFRGLSLAEVARRSGVCKQTVFNIEHGRHNPALTTLSAIAGALDLSCSVVFEAHDAVMSDT